MRQTLRQYRGRPRGRGLACRAWEQKEKVGERKGEKRWGEKKKTQDKMRSLLAYVCWYDVRTQTSVVIPVSTDLNLYAHTHSPISRREDRLHLYADGFLETIPSLTSSFLPSSSVIHYSSPKLNLKCQKAFFLSLLILPFSQPYPPSTHSPSISFLPPTAPSLPPSPLFSVWFCTDGRSS